jgi:hypothetical protein
VLLFGHTTTSAAADSTTLIVADNMERVLAMSMPTTETAALNV